MNSVMTIFAIILSAIAITVSIYTFRRTHKTSIKPVLIFSNDIESPADTTSWYLQNVGIGPALNVIVGSGEKEGVWEAENFVLLPALSVQGRVHLDWVRAPKALVATYSDSFGQNYTSICVGNRNRVVELNLYPSLSTETSLHQLRKHRTSIKSSTQSERSRAE